MTDNIDTVHWFEYAAVGNAWTLHTGEDPTADGNKKVYPSLDSFNRTEADERVETSDNKVYIKVTGGVITGGTGTQIEDENVVVGGGVFVDSGTFTMTGGNIVGNIAEFGGGVCVASGKFEMSGGSIVGNSAVYGGGEYGGGNGGGVYVLDGTFTMTGGNIVGNSAEYGGEYGGGGGVYNSGTFTMTGGNIIGNSASGDGDYGGGGGVYVANSKFTMSGGSIVGNSATGSYGSGGGVFVLDGEFTMSGGSIVGNSAKYGGGGVFVFSDLDDSTFEMSGGSITGNSAEFGGGGVYVLDGTFQVSGTPVINGNKAGDPEADNNVYLDGSTTITVTDALTGGAEIWIAKPAGSDTSTPFAQGGGTTQHTVNENDARFFHPDAGFAGAKVKTEETPKKLVWDTNPALIKYHNTEYFAADITTGTENPFNGKATYDSTMRTLTLNSTVSLDYTLEIVAPMTHANPFTINLNDQILQRDEDTKFSLITIDSGAELKLVDNAASKTDKTFKVDSTTGLWVLNGEGADTPVPVTGGVITGGSANLGGGVCSYGTFTMSGGSIVGNSAWESGGVYNDGTFTMEGDASITGNSASDAGGGVYNDGTFTMEGDASITGNSASSAGGGVFVDSGEFTMKGGSITGNSAEDVGGGVYFNYGAFKVSGTPIISGNTAWGDTNNVYLNDDERLTLAGSFTGDIRISEVRYPSIDSGNPFGLAAAGVTEGAANFRNDDGTLCGTVNNGKLIWTADIPATYTVTAGSVSHGSLSVSPTSAAAGDTITVTATPDTGYRVSSLTYTPDGGTSQTISGSTFTMPAANVTVNAEFAAQKFQVTFDANGGSPTSTPIQETFDSTYVLPTTTPTRTGYNITGWYTAADGGSQITESTVVNTASEHTIYAHWTGIEYEKPVNEEHVVTFDSGLPVVKVDVGKNNGITHVTFQFKNGKPAVISTNPTGFKNTQTFGDEFDLSIIPADAQTGDVTVFFTTEKSGHYFLAHFNKNNVWEFLKAELVSGTQYKAVVTKESGFSPFQIVSAEPEDVPQSHTSSRDYGSSIWLPATAEPTPTPAAEQPTQAQPTAAPLQPTQASATPAPFVGLLAGLGAAAVFGLRRK